MDQWGRPGPTTASEWNRPENVELVGPALNSIAAVISRGPFYKFGAELRIRMQSREASEPSRMVRPNPDLLEKFLGLESVDDKKLRSFASSFGPLGIFCGPPESRDASVEYCDVWRYFARAITALLRIAARTKADAKDSEDDWILIKKAPLVMRDWYKRKEHSAEGVFNDPETAWSAMLLFIQRGKDRDRAMLVRLLNTLLQLGQVRPWVLWPEDSSRPRVVYSSPRLLSYLALQLCLRVGGLDSFVVCHHCRKEYSPPRRAPKANQRNFCPECREERMPQKYALKDYRKKKTSSKNG